MSDRIELRGRDALTRLQAEALLRAARKVALAADCSRPLREAIKKLDRVLWDPLEKVIGIGTRVTFRTPGGVKKTGVVVASTGGRTPKGYWRDDDGRVVKLVRVQELEPA